MSKRTLTKQLFRQQAIDEQRDRLYGDVIINQPISLSLLIISILLMVICIIIVLLYGNYARRETVKGYLVPDKGLIKIYAPLQGVLIKSHVQEGQKVKINDLLFTISTIKMNSDGGDHDLLLLSELEQQKSALTIKIEQEHLLNESRIKSVRKIILGIENELSQLDITIALMSKKLRFSFSDIEKYNSLFSNGYVSKIKLEQAEQVHLENETKLQTFQQQKLQLTNRASEYNLQVVQMPLEWHSRLSDLNNNISKIEQNMVEISGRRHYVIRAPVSGTLTAFQFAVGQVLNSQTPLITILPEGAKLQAELFLPTRAAGFITTKQSVLLKYEAFPYQHYGLHSGEVINIAQVILSPSELPIPLTLKEPVYRVRVDINEQFVNAYGKNFPLQAGMLLDADIVLAQRTLSDWLLEPVFSKRGRFLF